jgi:hypothetical protein
MRPSIRNQVYRIEFMGWFGGSAWESNPPARVLAPRTGFEVREPHQ